MSGYNKETGIFELTATKARYWYRRLPDQECQGKLGVDTMEYYACLFSKAGFDVLRVSTFFLQVRATPSQVWMVLSGRPSNQWQ